MSDPRDSADTDADQVDPAAAGSTPEAESGEDSAVSASEEESGSDKASRSKSLDRSLLTGIAWTGGMKWATQVFSWTVTLIVARLLTPEDYGLMGMALVYLGLVKYLSEFGIGTSIVQGHHLNRGQLSELGGFSVVAGVLFAAISMALSGPIAAFFGEPAVQLVVIVLSTSFIIDGLQILPRSLLLRDLNFRTVALVEGLTSFATMTTTLVLAILGFSYWSLVFGSLGGRAVSAVVLLFARPHQVLPPIHLKSIGAALRLGWHVVVSRLAWYTYSNADFAIVGRVLGTNPLGAYSLGWNLATLPVEKVSALTGRVTPAIFSAVQDDPPALRRYLAALTEGLALITFPASIGLALVADPFVTTVLGEKWLPAILPLQVLAVYGGFRSITTVLMPVLVVTGHSARAMHFSLLAAVVLPVCFYLGSPWGPAGVAAGWIVGYPLVVIPFYLRYVLRVVEMKWGEYWKTLLPAVYGTALMAVGVSAANLLVPASWPGWIGLVLAVVLGVGIYSAVILLKYRDRIERYREILRSVR